MSAITSWWLRNVSNQIFSLTFPFLFPNFFRAKRQREEKERENERKGKEKKMLKETCNRQGKSTNHLWINALSISSYFLSAFSLTYLLPSFPPSRRETRKKRSKRRGKRCEG